MHMEKNCPPPAVHILLSVTCFTHTNIETVVKFWYDVDMTVYRLG